MCSNRSLLLFGHGDGGGGPSEAHLQQLQRLQRCSGLPRIHTTTSPEAFFDEVQRDFYPPVEGACMVPLYTCHTAVSIQTGS